MVDIFAWILSIFILIAVFFINVFQLLSLIDLEDDYINPYESASRVNGVVIPEFLIQGSLCMLHLLTGHWAMFLFCLPYAYYNFRLYTEKRHLLDVTEIFNHLSWEKRLRTYKLGYLGILLGLSIFWMIWSIVEE